MVLKIIQYKITKQQWKYNNSEFIQIQMFVEGI